MSISLYGSTGMRLVIAYVVAMTLYDFPNERSVIFSKQTKPIDDCGVVGSAAGSLILDHLSTVKPLYTGTGPMGHMCPIRHQRVKAKNSFFFKAKPDFGVFLSQK